MPKERNVFLLLQDIKQNIEKALRYTKDLSFDDFLAQEIIQDATLRVIQVVGEACYRATKEQKQAYPQIEWAKIARSRHILVHHYETIDFVVIWRIIQEHLPLLAKQIEEILTRQS